MHVIRTNQIATIKNRKAFFTRLQHRHVMRLLQTYQNAEHLCKKKLLPVINV